MHKYILALDQGTTSSRAIIFDETGTAVSIGQVAFRQIYPHPGWVEHDPMDILSSQYEAIASALEKSGINASDILGIGITNQRETTVIWDRHTGKPLCNAIVWQCRRTAEICEQLKRDGMADLINERAGLLIDAYFSGTKIKWALDNIDGAKARAENGDLIFGTVESWLIWNLTEGVHVTDHTNASRTMLFHIDKLAWDEDLCKMLGVPMSMLPKPVPNSMEYGKVKRGIKGLEALAGIPICGAVGDQQAALLGQGCIEKGQAKNTYGTGCFTLMNVGEKPVRYKDTLLSTIAWTIGGKTQYALEGSIFNAGSTIQWLADELKLISGGRECDELARTVSDNGGVYLVSAFTGLGAPYWDMYARGAIVGITRGTTRAHIARAALEGIAFQVKDLLDAMEKASGSALSVLKVDGGVSNSDFTMQFESDILRKPIDRPSVVETTAMGAAFAAGLSAGVWTDMSDIQGLRTVGRIFTPQMEEEKAVKLHNAWKRAVERSANWETK